MTKFKNEDPLKIEFNVTSITKYGNDGGTKVTLTPSNKNIVGSIEINIADPNEGFEFGKYIVDFNKTE